MLKTLIIKAKWIGSEWDETVSSASLRKLVIYCQGGCADLLNSKSISFDTPSLLYLVYSVFVAEDYPKVNLTNLVEAKFNLMLLDEQIEQIREPNDEDDVFLRLGNVLKLFAGIRNVQKLYLSANILEVLSLCCESFPVFNNLKILRIRSAEDRGWQAMPVLLRNCPHLETLVLEGLIHYVTGECGNACDCKSREGIVSSLLSCPVKKVQIKGFKGTMRESSMIWHFMTSFPCLKEMEVVYADFTTIFEIVGR
ncbi:putative leucine-rich repeat domain superfamily [Arabidopsis thaliana]